MVKLLLLLSSYILRSTLVASKNCFGLNEVCKYDCECCGHPDNKAIRCEERNLGAGKRCFEGRKHTMPCEHDHQCLSQKCIRGICLRQDRIKTPVRIDAMHNEDNDVSVENGLSAKCACDRVETESVYLAIDGDLSTDYTNYHSIFPAIITEPSFTSPIRIMEVCSSSQDVANDPLCFRIAGYCEKTHAFSWVQHGSIPLTEARQDCKNVTVYGRVNYPLYKVELGCRRGGYSSGCYIDQIEELTCDLGRAGCDEVTPKGKDPKCTPLHDEDGTDSFSEFHVQSIDYNIEIDQTVFTYSFMNKLSDCKFFPDLSHAVLQYVGTCCVALIRVYEKLENEGEFNYYMNDSAGTHLKSPKPTVCMSGIDLPGVEGSKTFYYEITINGKFTTPTLVDYVLKGGKYVKYGKVDGPDCRCEATRALAKKHKKRTFRGLPSLSRKAPECVDKPVSISELKMYGKSNEE